MRKLQLVLFTCIFIDGCAQESGHVYNQPLNDIHRTLEKTAVPYVFSAAALDFDVVASDPSKVTWILKRQGSEFIYLDANLSIVDERSTRIVVHVRGATVGESGNLASTTGLRHMYTVAMEEQIASTIEHRPFDWTHINPAIIAVSVANQSEMREQLERGAAESEKKKQENISKAYTEEASGHH